MYRLGLTGRLARWAATRPWITIGIRVVLIALAIVSATGLGEVLTQDAELSVPTESEVRRYGRADVGVCGGGGNQWCVQ